MPLEFRPNVLRMQPYVPGKPVEEVQRELGLTDVVKLASNENPFGPSPRAVRAIQEAALRLHQYPDGAAFELRTAIANHYGVPFHRVVVGNGSDELIHLMGLIFLGHEGHELIMGDPGFSRYDASAYLAPSRLVKVPLTSDFRHDVEAMAAAITPQTRMIFIANPNNPTGTVISREEFEWLADRTPDHVALVLDEAYFEYAVHATQGRIDLPNAADYTDRYPNVIGMRTFSKAYGLAGIRLGFALVPDVVADAIHRAREPFNVNSLAQAAGIAALSDQEHIRQTVENNTAGLRRLSDFLRAQGATPIDSYANFAYADLGRSGDEVYTALLQQGVIIRAGSHVGHPHCIRVSVGTPAELDRFEAAFRHAVGAAKVGVAA